MNTSRDSGIQPLEFNVLVKPENVEEKTKGGLVLPDSVISQDKNAQTIGTLIAVSPMAFSWDEWPKEKPKPAPGDRVYYGRYAGASSKVKGADGEEYLLMKDADLTAMVTQ